MDKDFFDHQLKIALDFSPLTKDWSDDDKAAFIKHTSAHILNNWAMVSNRKPRS